MGGRHPHECLTLGNQTYLIKPGIHRPSCEHTYSAGGVSESECNKALAMRLPVWNKPRIMVLRSALPAREEAWMKKDCAGTAG